MLACGTVNEGVLRQLFQRLGNGLVVDGTSRKPLILLKNSLPLLPLNRQSEAGALCGRRFRPVGQRRYRQRYRNFCLALYGFRRTVSENQPRFV